MTDTTRTMQPAVAKEKPAADLVKDLSEQVSRLVRDELQLAKVEMTSKGKRAGAGAGMLGGSGILALYGIGCLLAAAVIGLAIVLPAWLAALIVGAAVLAVAGVAALMGRNKLKAAAPPVPEQAVDSVKADVAEVKERTRR
jgi:membrane protein